MRGWNLPDGSDETGTAAGVAIRGAARVVDAVFVAGLAAIAWSVAAMILSGAFDIALADYGTAVSVVSALGLTWYFVWYESAEGQTLGKQVLRLRTIGPGGGFPGKMQALRRNGFVAVVSLAALLAVALPAGAWIVAGLAGAGVALYAVAVGVTIRSSPSNQGMHDRFAGDTRVVTARPVTDGVT